MSEFCKASSMPSKHILVTGGSGFVGSYAVNALRAKGYAASPYDKIGGEDILNLKQLEGAVKLFMPDWIIHLAGQVYLTPSLQNPQNDAMLNIIGSLNVLEMARKYKCGVTFSSSGAVYGNNYQYPEPVSPYGVSKLAVEDYCKLYNKLYGVHTVVFRFSSVYGYGRAPTSINLIIAKALKGETIKITGDGEQTRDFCVTGDTLVLMANLAWLPISDIKTGDSVVSFDERANGKKRMFRISKVEAVTAQRSSNVYRIYTEDGEVSATGNHPWLTKGNFRSTDKLRVGTSLRLFSEPIRYFTTNSYEKGYLFGAMSGDGYCIHNANNYFVGIAASDKEMVDAVADEFSRLNFKIRRSVRHFKYKKSKPAFVAQSCYRMDYEIYQRSLNNMLHWVLTDPEFCRGYVAGFFDAEGYKSNGCLRISNKENQKLTLVQQMMTKYGFTSTIKPKKPNLFTLTICGGLQESVRFFNVFHPKVGRKAPSMDAREAKGRRSRVFMISKLPPQKVYNLQTSDAHTFVANGFLCHNTYVTDVAEALVMSAEKKFPSGVYDIGTGTATSLNQLISYLEKLLDKKINVEYIPEGVGDPKRNELNVSKAAIYGFKAKTSLDDGLKEMVRQIT